MFIVLKVFNDSGLACFLDKTQGKFLAHYSLRNAYMKLVPGSLVRGDLVQGNGRYARLQNVSLEYLGLLSGQRAQYFLYFLLELAYLFLPQHHESEESFMFLKASIESTSLSLCDERPAFGIMLSIWYLGILGFAVPDQLALRVDIQEMLEDWDAWVEQEKMGKGLTLPQALILKYDSLWGDSLMWISECLRDHPQFKKIEKKWLWLLHENTGAGCGKVEKAVNS